uniref:Uncharacterized protein n=1 Tax=Anguilla anguilla TaxID=7936 RepID=A0A0E9RUA3_ANGAN
MSYCLSAIMEYASANHNAQSELTVEYIYICALWQTCLFLFNISSCVCLMSVYVLCRLI